MELLDKLEISRQEAIAQAISVIDRTIAEYEESSVHCRRCDGKGFECDAMTLGALIKGCKQIGLWPAPDPPYDGMSFLGLARNIRQMMFPTLCTFEMDCGHLLFRSSYDEDSVCVGVKETIEASIRSLEDGLCGLKLDGFKGKETADNLHITISK